MSSDTTVDYIKFEVSKFEAPKPEENERSMGQLVSYPSYNSGSLYLQFPWIKLYTYGIPRLGEYYKTDDDRSHLRIPLDLSIPEIADFVTKIKAYSEGKIRMWRPYNSSIKNVYHSITIGIGILKISWLCSWLYKRRYTCC